MHRHEHHQETTVGSKRIHVYSKTTGKKQIIPEAWLSHPVLGADFQKTPLTRRREAASKTPMLREGGYVISAEAARSVDPSVLESINGSEVE